MTKNFNISFLSLLFINGCLAEFPTDITKCKAGDVKCITNSINDILKKNPNGREDIGFPNINPYKIKKVIISDANHPNSLNLDLVFLEVEVYGLPTAIVEKSVGFSQDATNSKFEIYGVLPKLELKCKYTANGRILILPIQGEGDSKIVANNVKFSIKFKPTVSKENGKIFFDNNKVKVLLDPERLQIRLDNLFNGNKVLGENMNTFLNENWKDVWMELAPNINSVMADILKDILSGVFKKITYDNFYI